ncbi:F-box/FBD/LRR-repeat protein At1g13570 [Medicago truncatula]|nr:F-box/FBD/LRR-repeat protein At1g13570 [Medicago truncatula]
MTDIQRWIIHLTRRPIKEFVLHIWLDERYKIPWCLFSCQSLHHLELKCCWLKPPTTFEGFKNLKSLELSHVTMTQDSFENMISNSPFLEKLMLFNLDGFSQINIHGPNLKVAHISGEFEDISFENTFRLVELTMYLDYGCNLVKLRGCSSNLLRFFVHLPHIQSLEIHHYFLEYLAAGVVPIKLPTPCINLRHLSLCIDFDDLKKILAALCLLKSSPNLRKLEIIAPEELTGLLTSTSYCWENIFSEPTMPIEVRHVRMHGISGFKSELDFIRFLLLYSPVLEKMIVEPDLNAKPELLTELVRFKRASRQAEVIYNVENSS